MRCVRKDVVAIELLRSGNATHIGKQALHVVVMTVGRNHLIQIAISDKYLPAASLERMQVRRVRPDVLRELSGQIPLLDEKLLLVDRAPVERWIFVDPIAIDPLAESARCT